VPDLRDDAERSRCAAHRNACHLRPGTATIGFSDLVFAPGTDGSPRRLYLTDHGEDNDPFQRGDNDGKIYQVKIEARP
jgi:hypothetical protein